MLQSAAAQGKTADPKTKPCALKGLARSAAKPKHPKTTKAKNEKTASFPKKAFRKKAPDQAKSLRFKGFGPKRGEAQAPKNHQKKKEKNSQFSEKGLSKKSARSSQKPAF